MDNIKKINLNDKVSIIIPVYNAGNYLEECLKSILKQTYKNIEIILIDDGSTDSSGKICDVYSKKDCRIKVIHSINRGVSSSRNTGIKLAQGKYIVFIDSDDYINEDMIEDMIEGMKKSDLAICGYNRIESQNKIKKVGISINKHIINMEELENYMGFLLNKLLFNSPANKMYKKELINQYFDEQLSMGEDLLFNLEYIKNISSIRIIREELYNYRIHDSNSLSSCYRHNMFEIQKLLYNKILENFKERKFRNFNIAYSYFIKSIIHSVIKPILKNDTLSYSQKKKLIAEICDDNEVIESIKLYSNKTMKDLVWSIFIRFNSMTLFKLLNLLS